MPATDPQYIGFECHLCGTRMYGLPHQVGQQFKCPDCGARTALPSPPKPKRKNIPAALEGEQYELWEPDVSPTEVVAHQPKYVAVKCRQCDTLMYATEKQIGETIACPDCGTQHVVPRPPAPKRKASSLASDIETPMLDPAAAPGERPLILPPRHKMHYEEQQEAEYARALEKSRRTGKPMEIDARGRPILPRWPLITGVLPFLVSPGVAVRWLALTLSFMAGGAVLLGGIQIALGGGMGAVAGMCFFAVGCILVVLVSAMAASYFLAIVAESSTGSKEVQDWPFVFDWIGGLLYLIVAGMVSAVPGSAIAQFVFQDPHYQAISVAASIVLFFPLVVLSQLHLSSPWGVVSPQVVGSLFRYPFSWLTFYVESGALAALGLAAEMLGPWALVPVATAGLFLYGRLLGRLAWRLAEGT